MSITPTPEAHEGRLCGDCFKAIAKGEMIQAHPNGRHYHLGCNAGKVLFGDHLNPQPAITPARRDKRGRTAVH